MASFSENLKRIRKTKGLTQMSLSTLSNVSQSTICEIEKNEYTPKMTISIKLANALNISVTNLDEELEKNVRSLGATLISEDITRYSIAEKYESIKLIQYTKDLTVKVPLDLYVEQKANEIIYLPNVKKKDFAIKICDDSICGNYPQGTFLHCHDAFPQHGKLVVAHMKTGELKFKIYAIKDQKQYLMAISNNDLEDCELSSDITKIWTAVASLRRELSVDSSSNVVYNSWQERLEKL